ncbi:efflux RND transporter permease subunit [Pedobacter sp. Hv1]|uniref:efflux RND transporter permease subunit n=1 Tax=Pedobacter sp. Hv1 TaxID=1740090 RepID=UPI0006D893BA|nr:efflux RND transporter permease subunit [Pedobacter sp. Hv1]KQB99427.1 hypothetical protein AQF98_17815 [Pedobacter sp. Hv1]
MFSISKLLSPFRIVLLFIAFAILGILLIPKLQVDLLPKEPTQTLYVSFSLPNSSPETVEQQGTSILEGAFSQLAQLKDIKSVSSFGQGSVQLFFDKSADMQMKQFEVTSILRQVQPKLPENASYPLIFSDMDSEQKESPLLIYTINAHQQPFQIKQKCEGIFRKALATYPGIKTIVVSGAVGLQLTLRFSREKCESWHINPNSITSALSVIYKDVYPGLIRTQDANEYFIRLVAPTADISSIKKIRIEGGDKQTYYIGDIADVYIEEREPLNYFRVNGKNSVNLSIYVQKGENRVVLGNALKALVENTERQLPKDYQLRLNYDDTEFLSKEIAKNYQRTGLSIVILFVFILFAYRSWKYLLNLFLGLVVSFCIIVVFVWLFKVNVHLYTIAGLSIAFGLMIDNAIVTLDYFYRFRNPKVFTALLGATLTTVVALGLVFLLPAEDRKNLSDFCMVIILAIFSSLLSALWFNPAIYFLLNGKVSTNINNYGVKKIKDKLRSQARYFKFTALLAKYRKSFIFIVVIGFGLPLFMLPTKLDDKKWYSNFYNSSIGSQIFQENIKPYLEKITGGTLRIFLNNIYDKSSYRDPEKTKLYVNAQLPYGNSMEQMNDIIIDLEQFLRTIKGIDKFITKIYSGQQGDIEITFKEDLEYSELPLRLKSSLIARSLSWGGVTWDIFGVGRGFSNEAQEEIPSFKVKMKGYNYDELEQQANDFAKRLANHKRIQKIDINEQVGYEEKQSEEYILNLDAKQMALYNTSQFEILNQLDNLSKPTGYVTQITMDNQFYPVVLKEKLADTYSYYDMLHHGVTLDSSRTIQVEKVGSLKLHPAANSIYKEDRQYVRVVSFNYIGSSQFGKTYLDQTLDEMKQRMPIGYTAEDLAGNWNSNQTQREYELIFILIVSVFFICSILFGNLKESLFVVSIIPISFIGLFLIFVWGDFYFDQGGYAAFVMVGGLVANAAIYIVNDFNNAKKRRPSILHNQLLIKVVANRSKTIMLVIISSSCGLIPFLLEGQNEIFWFSLAIGTIGGLIFSTFAIFIALPVFLWKKR